MARKNARRSIVIINKILKGDVIEEKNITYKRPFTGVSPVHWDEVIGKKVNKNLESDHILQWSDID